jgi:hypothetical protein
MTSASPASYAVDEERREEARALRGRRRDELALVVERWRWGIVGASASSAAAQRRVWWSGWQKGGGRGGRRGERMGQRWQYNTTISLKIGGVGQWLGQWRRRRRRSAWRRRQRWIAARRRQMTGPIEGDLGITARRGQRTSTTIPGGAVDSLDCSDGRVFAGATTIVRRMRGRATSCAVRVWTTPQRERTAGGIRTTTGGPGNGDIDVEALAVRATHCR